MRVRRTARLVTVSSLAWVAACIGVPEGSPQATELGMHAEVSCVSCHAGPLADGTSAAIPAATCTASACHSDGGPRNVELASVRFQHRGHAGDTVVSLGCAGCHSHDRGDEALVAGVDACSLCHLSEQSAGSNGECRICHAQLDHEGRTSQGVEVPHDGLPWIEGGCVRCHYDVTEAPVAVPTARCVSCHVDLDAAVAQGIGEDLHGAHTGTACTTCHDSEAHRIRAMTSAVELRCADCHVSSHDLTPTATASTAPATCDDCHGGAHGEQQRLLLGLVPDLPEASPSEKFMDGLTCRSCHRAEPGADPRVPVSGSSASCEACHSEGYSAVMDWWVEGGRARVTSAETFLGSIASRLNGASDSTAALLASADRMIALVRDAGAIHNVPLAHRLLEEAMDRAASVAATAGQGASPPPLGRRPRMGLCSYCHFGVDDPGLDRPMSGWFHEAEITR